MTRALTLAAVGLAALVLGALERAPRSGTLAADARVVAVLGAPPLAVAPEGATRLEREQRAFRRALAEEIPAARVDHRYRLVANGFALTLPASELARLRSLPGVSDVAESALYGVQLDRTPRAIGAPALWGSTLQTAGSGVKIGVIDTGVDPRHPFFDPEGYTAPPGFPKGQARFTSAKVIVARAFPPPGVRAAGARLAFDGEQSSHGTHVAGIAAGNGQTEAVGGRIVSGVAPRAYIGNYKALVRTDAGLSPNGNSPELVAAIEAAVRDGMDVLNLSIGEPEIEPVRDIVASALDAAAAAGVVSVVAAGNDYNDVGAGSISSPANSARAIAVAAADLDDGPASATRADFSSVGPTTMSLRLKPEVTAPGVGILSAVPGGWSFASGTSMAAPHVAGAAALLRQRHPRWSVAQLTSALVLTGTNVADRRSGLLPPTFQGGGLVSLPAADRPLVFAQPSSVSFGLVGRGARMPGAIALTDAGEGAGTWQVRVVRPLASTGSADLVVPASVHVPGTLEYVFSTPQGVRQGEVSGFVELRRGGDVRRIPFWARVAVPALGRHAERALPGPGVYRASTRGRPALVLRYRYPENPVGVGVPALLRGPELVYRFRLRRAAVNFGAVITQSAPGVGVQPRVVARMDENRLTGYAGLPLHHNPYLQGFRTPVPAAAALSPLPGEYAVVFDSASRGRAGRFTFRFWVNDVTPPTLRVRSRSVRAGAPIVVGATDDGSGVYPASIRANIGGIGARATYRRGVIRLATAGLPSGRHRLVLRVSDYQETKNTENVRRILPNTRTLRTTITIRP